MYHSHGMFPGDRNPEGSGFLRHARRVMAMTAAIVLGGIPAFAQQAIPSAPAAGTANVEIVSAGGEPELRVGGIPFFVHAAQFDYFRIPRDLWAHSLLRYRDMGINTIDIRIPWNWHETSDAQFDFDGHTNPSRDLLSLLGLVTQMRFKLIVRPGPLIGDHWLNDGIPSWLLGYSDYGMRAVDIQDGVAPPDAQLAARDSNAAARGWLANEIHMSYSRRWLTAVAGVLAPYTAKRMISIHDPDDPDKDAQKKQIPGPLLFVVLDDAVSILPGAKAPDLAKYLAELRRALVRGGLDAISFLNMPDAAVRGPAPFAHTSAHENAFPVGLAGQWIFDPRTPPATLKAVSVNSATAFRETLLATEDALSLSFLARSLATQPDFPPFISAFSATTFAPAGDTRAAQPAPANTLLASRLLLGNGIRGIVYTPLQDTLTPVGWETPSAARYFRWDAPLDLAGNRGPRANGVARNARFISAWGAMLAASHVRSDFGIVDLRESVEKPDPAASARYAEELQQLCRVAALTGYAPDFVNPATQPVERLLRDSVIVLFVPRDDGNHFQLSEQAQATLVEFVSRGGALVYFPARPHGSRIDALWQGAPVNSSAGDNFDEWAFERGRVIAAPADFYSEVPLAGNLGQNKAQPENSTAVKLFSSLMVRSGARRTLRMTKSGEADAKLIVSQLVPNYAAWSEQPPTCAEKQLCAAELISVTNLNDEQSAEQSFDISEPSAAGAGPAPSKISIDVTVPPRDSLLLPVHAPLCSATAPGEKCSDEVIVAGAELLGARRDGKTLELPFYVPSRATVRLQLESAPSRVEYEEDFRAETEWNQETRELVVQLPRGPSPGFARVLRIRLRYTPHVKEKEEAEKQDFRGLEYEVYNAMRYRLGPDVTIPTSPPLLIADANSGGRMVIATRNYSDDFRTADFSLDGAFHGTGFARVSGNRQQITPIRIQPSRSQAENNPPAAPLPEGLLGGQLTIHSGRDRGSGPVLFLTADDAGNSHYQYDFERNASPDWVLESSRLRLIVSPAYSGRALALVDKKTNDDLLTLGGGLHDFLIAAGTPPKDIPITSDFAFNRGYRAEWTGESAGAGLRLTYREYEKSPAGLHIEKTLHFLKPETIEASYRVSFIEMPPAHTEISAPDAGKSFVSEVSVPLMAGNEGTSRFCWRAETSPAPANSPSTPNATAPIHCEDFIPSGDPISVPEGIARMEIDSPGGRTLLVEWSSARAIIVPRAFSSQIRFAIRVPQSQEPPGEFVLRYTVGEGL
jgi:hypothetical protein